MQRALYDVWDGLRTRRLRTGLSLVALALGMTALTAVLAIVGGLRAKSADLIRELGVQVFAVVPPGASAGGAPSPLTEADLDLLRSNLPTCDVTGFAHFQTAAPGVDAPVAVLASDERLCAVRQWRVVSGRNLDGDDCRHNERYAVLTAELQHRLGCTLGQTVTLLNVPFTVVGVIATGNGALDLAENRAALAPPLCAVVPRGAARLWQTQNQVRQHALDAIFVRVAAAPEMERMALAAQRVLDGPDRHAGDLGWITPATLVRDLRRFQLIVTLIAGSIGTLCLLLGGVTLMSLMVANVRERLNEIGLRRALGATPRDVAGLFLLEGWLVTGLAAAAGTRTACLLLRGAALFVAVPYELGAATLLTPLIAALGLGAVSSYEPARLAARVAPAEALRAE